MWLSRGTVLCDHEGRCELWGLPGALFDETHGKRDIWYTFTVTRFYSFQIPYLVKD